MLRQKFSVTIATDCKTATIYVRGSMKRRWRKEHEPVTTKTTFRNCHRSDMPNGLNPLLRDLLNLGCITSLRYPRFRKTIVLALNSLSTTAEFSEVWKRHTGKEVFAADMHTADTSGYRYGEMVGTPYWRPTR